VTENYAKKCPKYHAKKVLKNDAKKWSKKLLKN
jgi:hypothetical protein